MFKNKAPHFAPNDGRRRGGRQTGFEETIRSEKIAVEHKMFYLLLKQNQRGKFLRITEESNGKSDTIIIPSTGLGEFCDLLADVLRTSEETDNEEPTEEQQFDDEAPTE